MRWLLVLVVFCFGCDDEVRYADGTLWNPVMPLSPGRILPRDMSDREWGSFVTQSGIQADRSVKDFTPTWTGFSAAPTDLKYMDFGVLVAVWSDGNGVGTSNSTSFSLSGMPKEIRPTGQRSVLCLLMDNGLEAPGRMIIDTDGTAFFQREVISGANLQYSTTAFTAANVKGLVVGAVILYAK